MIVKLRVYPGADVDFTLYSDDGVSYGYEMGEYKTTKLHWDDAKEKLTHEGMHEWFGDKIVDVLGR